MSQSHCFSALHGELQVISHHNLAYSSKQHIGYSSSQVSLCLSEHILKNSIFVSSTACKTSSLPLNWCWGGPSCHTVLTISHSSLSDRCDLQGQGGGEGGLSNLLCSRQQEGAYLPSWALVTQTGPALVAPVTSLTGFWPDPAPVFQQPFTNRF